MSGRTRTSASLPLPHHELGLERCRLVADTQLDVLRADLLVERESGATTVVAVVRALARKERDDLVRAGLQVSEVQLLHTTAMQRLHFAIGVEVVRHFLVVDLQRHRIESEERTD